MTVFESLPSWYFLALIAAVFITVTMIAVLAYLTICKRPFVTLSGWSKYGGFSLEARSDSDEPESGS